MSTGSKLFQQRHNIRHWLSLAQNQPGCHTFSTTIPLDVDHHYLAYLSSQVVKVMKYKLVFFIEINGDRK